MHAEVTEEGLSARYLDTINLFNYGYGNFALEDIEEEYDLIRHKNSKETHITSRFQHRDVKVDMSSLGEVNFEETEIKEKKEEGSNKFLIIVLTLILIAIFYRKRRIKLKKKAQKKNLCNRLYKFKYDI